MKRIFTLLLLKMADRRFNAIDCFTIGMCGALPASGNFVWWAPALIVGLTVSVCLERAMSSNVV